MENSYKAQILTALAAVYNTIEFAKRIDVHGYETDIIKTTAEMYNVSEGDLTDYYYGIKSL